MGAYIPDGYMLTGYITEERNGDSILWEACRFKYRPATAPEVDELNMLASKNDAEVKRQKFLTDHIVEWNLSYNGDILPIAPATMRQLYKGFREVFFGIICGVRHSDDDPESKSKPPSLESLAKN